LRNSTTDTTKASDAQGLLLLNKKPGLTSFESLFAVKRALNTRKVGHTGTLDKFASGLLIVLAGKTLKLAPWFSSCAKEYEALVRFGIETATLDPEGEITGEGPLPLREDVEKALGSFKGEILQAPPEYSAIHVGGIRAHELARSGRKPEMKKRPVTIYEIELTSWAPPMAGLRVRCSAGTYIRSLARDLALAVCSRGYLASLCRTRIGGFRLEDAVEAERLSLNSALKPITPAVLDALNMKYFSVNTETVQKIIHGKVISHAGLVPGTYGIFSGDEEPALAAIIEHKDNKWKYNHVFAGNAGGSNGNS
jgi:tRNA pseudouridine55 synthase